LNKCGNGESQGYSLEERQAILNEQAAQIAAKKSARDADREQACRYDNELVISE
jgi:hypothetical protein